MTGAAPQAPDADRRAAGPWPVLIIAVDVLALAYAASTYSYSVWGAFLVIPVLTAITIPMVVRGARRSGHPEMSSTLALAWAARLAGTAARYYVTFGVDYHLDDSSNYDLSGAALASSYRHFHFVLDHTAGSKATEWMRSITGGVYAIIGHTELGGYFVFSWFGFLGLYFCYRAFCLALPDCDHRRYARLLFFLPSLIFWPSAIGKDAWTLLGVGLVAYGTARILVRRPGGLVVLTIGMTTCTLVRPHVSVILFCGLIVAVVLRRGGGLLGSAKKWVALGVLALMAVVVVGQAKQFFGVEQLNTSSVNQVLANAQSRSSVGKSAFAAAPVRSPLDLPAATVSVLFRPFPWEAHNAVNLIASAEGLFLLGLCVLSFRRLLRIPGMSLREPYVAFVAVYTVLFIIAFSHVGNFGILSRQRTQLFPLALCLICLPTDARRRTAGRRRNQPLSVVEDAPRRTGSHMPFRTVHRIRG